jgi:hypothetical protein
MYGQALRQFVGTSFVNANWFSNQFQGFTGGTSYLQQTLALAIAGFYPPTGFADWNPSLQWSPVPYAINNSVLDLSPTSCVNYNVGMCVS